MVARKIDRDTLIDLYCLYVSPHHDFTIKDLAEKVNISRSRLGELFKKINPDDLTVDYGVDNNKYLPVLEEWLNTQKSINHLAHKYSIPKSTLHRKFQELTNG